MIYLHKLCEAKMITIVDWKLFATLLLTKRCSEMSYFFATYFLAYIINNVFIIIGFHFFAVFYFFGFSKSGPGCSKHRYELFKRSTG